MNNTNRALNRLLIGLIGLMLLAGGAAVAAAALIPDALAAWQDGAQQAGRQVDALLNDTSLSDDAVVGAGQSWLLLAVMAAAALMVALLIVFIVRQGHGHAATLLTVRPDAAGSASDSGSVATAATDAVVISSAVAMRSLTAALTDYSGVASVGVTAFRVQGATALKIVVSARRGVSPGDIRDHVDAVVRRFDAVLGAEVPVFIKITGGFASRLSKRTRLAVAQ